VSKNLEIVQQAASLLVLANNLLGNNCRLASSLQYAVGLIDGLYEMGLYFVSSNLKL
jgi:hypothetical protein